MIIGYLDPWGHISTSSCSFCRGNRNHRCSSCSTSARNMCRDLCALGEEGGGGGVRILGLGVGFSVLAAQYLCCHCRAANLCFEC